MDDHELLRGLGRAMRARRASLGLSQEAFADAIGMHRAYYGHIERGTKNLTVATLSKICSGLDLRVSEIFAALDR
ncbi:helix-turn-helix transcriptional regulator [Stenotrophomonas maltophilia]|uniref:helix-turn-helix transcriptional regulator n=1 Tax=Stenotrophomonas maltophilia TaxID=40324 RepID=UPI00165872C6|nr:helix-turn-helix transcriptional regulator [Stenotrophomonas maltophilia]MBC9114596.1 helix-turn-helix transcriptional regulator [Stenotrophomonas maltophilia]